MLFRVQFQVEIKTAGIDFALIILLKKKQERVVFKLGLVDHRKKARLSGGGAISGDVGAQDGDRRRGKRALSSTGYRAMKPVNRMMNVRDVNLTGDSGRLRRTADAANTEPYITFIAAQALVIPCTVRSLRIGR